MASSDASLPHPCSSDGRTSSDSGSGGDFLTRLKLTLAGLNPHIKNSLAGSFTSPGGGAFNALLTSPEAAPSCGLYSWSGLESSCKAQEMVSLETQATVRGQPLRSANLS